MALCSCHHENQTDLHAKTRWVLPEDDAPAGVLLYGATEQAALPLKRNRFQKAVMGVSIWRHPRSDTLSLACCARAKPYSGWQKRPQQ